MFVQCFTPLWMICLSQYAFSAPASPSSAALTSLTTTLSAFSASTRGRSCLKDTFLVRNSHVTLVVEFGRPLNHARMAVSLSVANAEVEEMIKRNILFADPDQTPVSYGYAEGTELQIYDSGQVEGGMTWGALGNVVRGLWLYLIEGERYESCHFDIFVASDPSIYTHIGWGKIMEPYGPSSNLMMQHEPGTRTQRKSRRMSRQSATPLPNQHLHSGISNLARGNMSVLAAKPINLALPPFHFRVPNTEMVLLIQVQSAAIRYQDVEVLLAKANTAIQFGIATYGANTSILDQTFRCDLDSHGIFIELTGRRPQAEGMTWHQLAEVVEGLALFYYASQSERCNFAILYGSGEVFIGVGRIEIA